MELNPEISPDYLPMDPKRLLERFHTALNARDLVNLANLLQVDFEQSWPGQGRQSATGLEPFRTEWERNFRDYIDFRADLLGKAIEGTTIWSEWRWEWKQYEPGQDEPARLQGVIVFGVEGGLLAWARYYMFRG